MMASPSSVPEANPGPTTRAMQQGIQGSTINYYDMMVIGKTGIGKSTTSDKLVMAHHGGSNLPQEIQADVVQPGEQIIAGDLSIWSISDASGELERAKQHLRNLMCFADDPNTRIDQYYGDPQEDRKTLRAQLVSNEMTNVRVLDVPGFFGDIADYRTTGSTSSDVTKSALTIMRQILRIQEAMKLNFKRIIYFIPERGPLQRANKILQIELETMVHYFGKSIFDCMVLVTTVNPDVYQYLPPDVVPFSPVAERQTRDNFKTTLDRVLTEDQLPRDKPPLVFFSKRDSCEDIIRKVRDATVIHDGIRLEFDLQTCARCGMREKVLNQGQGDKEAKMACYVGEDPSVAIPHADSFCHPMIISKHWKLTKVLGGIAHFVTRKRYLGKWPNFSNPDDEICIHCRQAPGSRGCMRVGASFELEEGVFFRVDHSSSVDEKIEIDVSDIGSDF